METPGSGAGAPICQLVRDIEEHSGPTTDRRAATRSSAADATDASGQCVAGTDFRPISSLLDSLVQQISEALIRRTEAEGNNAKAARLRAAYRELWEGRHAA